LLEAKGDREVWRGESHHFIRNEAEEIVLLIIYAKSEIDNIKGPALKEIRRALED